MDKEASDIYSARGLTPKASTKAKLGSSDLLHVAKTFNSRNPEDPIDFDQEEKRGSVAATMFTHGGNAVKMDTEPHEHSLVSGFPSHVRNLSVIPRKT